MTNGPIFAKAILSLAMWTVVDDDLHDVGYNGIDNNWVIVCRISGFILLEYRGNASMVALTPQIAQWSSECVSKPF